MIFQIYDKKIQKNLEIFSKNVRILFFAITGGIKKVEASTFTYTYTRRRPRISIFCWALCLNFCGYSSQNSENKKN